MALVLGMEVGRSVYIGDKKVRLTKIHNPNRFVVRVETSAMDSEYEITDAVRTEILPSVYVQAGDTGNDQMVKMVIEAPKSIVILRDKLRPNGRRH